MQPRRVVFLDFDGVLHPAVETPEGTALFQWIPQLAGLLQSHPDVAIVIHSTWREAHTLAQMRALLGPLGDRVVGAVGAGEKAQAILDYLHAHPQIERWIVIDDAAAQFQVALPDTVVACDPLTGICGPQVQAALREWLRSSATPPEPDGRRG